MSSDMDLEPGECPPSVSVASPSRASSGMMIGGSYGPTNLNAFLLNTHFNTLLSNYLSTRDLFMIQFLNRSIFTLCNSNGTLLQKYYSSCRLDSFVPFMVDDAFVQSMLTPTYLDLPDGSRAVRNTYSMHIRHLYLNFCTRISNHSLGCIGLHCGSNLQTLNLEGGGRSRINEFGMRVIFQACTNLTAINLNGFYQINMVETLTSLSHHCRNVRSLSLSGCSQMNDSSISILCRTLRLHTLHLECCNLSDTSLQQIGMSMKDGLSNLSIGYNGALTDRGLASLVTSCRALRELSLYGCYSFSRHALSYLRLCPLLEKVDLSRIQSLDDSSLAEWILPTNIILQHQQAYQQQQQHQHQHHHHPPSHHHSDYNPNLSQILQATSQDSETQHRDSSIRHLRHLSLDSCQRITPLGLKIILEQCLELRHLNAYGLSNLTNLALESLLRIIVDGHRPLEFLEVGGCSNVPVREKSEIEKLTNTFKGVKL